MNEDPRRKDIVIIGGGIAGLTAAMYASAMALNCVVIEKSPYLGQLPESFLIRNYPGIRNIKGEDLSREIEVQAKKDFSVEITREEVVDVVMDSTAVPYRFLVKTKYGHFLSKTIVIATGSRSSSLNVEGGSLPGVTYYPAYDSEELVRKDIVIVGTGDSSIQFACGLKEKAKTLTLVEERSNPSCSPMNLNELNKLLEDEDIPVKLITNHALERFIGTERVEKVAVRNLDTGEESEITTGAVIVSIGRIPNSELAEKLGCETDREGYVIVNREQKTHLEGVFAAGNVAGITYHSIKSAGEGCVAGIKAAEYLRTGVW